MNLKEQYKNLVKIASYHNDEIKLKIDEMNQNYPAFNKTHSKAIQSTDGSVEYIKGRFHLTPVTDEDYNYEDSVRIQLYNKTYITSGAYTNGKDTSDIIVLSTLTPAIARALVTDMAKSITYAKTEKAARACMLPPVEKDYTKQKDQIKYLEGRIATLTNMLND